MEACEDNKTHKLYCLECLATDGKHVNAAHEKGKPRFLIKDEAIRI
jgi:hypothetical protein